MLALTYDDVLLKKEFVHHNFVILKLIHFKVKKQIFHGNIFHSVDDLAIKRGKFKDWIIDGFST
jgi:hypothetical protein